MVDFLSIIHSFGTVSYPTENKACKPWFILFCWSFSVAPSMIHVMTRMMIIWEGERKWWIWAKAHLISFCALSLNSSQHLELYLPIWTGLGQSIVKTRFVHEIFEVWDGVKESILTHEVSSSIKLQSVWHLLSRATAHRQKWLSYESTSTSYGDIVDF